MEAARSETASRRLMIGTSHGIIEGSLALAPQVRTLDFLNRASTRFLLLHAARSLTTRASFQGDSVHINAATIVWVSEVGAVRRTGAPASKPQLSRTAVRFSFADGEVLGFLHTPAGGDAFARLNQERGMFLAVTSASITGPDTEMAAPFLAVNSSHVFAIEAMTQGDNIEVGLPVFEQAEP